MTHPNDTLNGKLLAHERPEEKHLRRRFGYWHMVEERMVRKELIAEGHDPTAFGFFSLMSNRILDNHKDNPKPWHDRHGLAYGGAIRQQAAFERNEMKRIAIDECVAALREIRDGHNDPRSLAMAVLAKLEEHNA